jgi:RND family efflux transporter MFP subunit
VVIALVAGFALGTRWTPSHGVTAPQPTAMPDMPGMAGMPGMEPMPPMPAGASSSAVYVSPARQQLIGVRTGVVERQHVEGTIRTVGVLAYDEARVTHVHTKVAGWVDQVFVDFVGKQVRRGQPLFSVYSPDLVTAQADYLVALQARQKLLETSPDSRAAADSLLAAARQRLQRWDVSDAEIAALERAGHASKTLVLSAPFDGVVLERTAVAGQYLTPDMSAFKVADLSTIWVVGQLFEYEAARVRPGEAVDVEFPYGQAPGTLEARVDFVYPEVDPQTRRVRFRASLQNKDAHLKPDTYVNVVLHGENVDRLVVPSAAVIDTGTRKYALIALPDGYFEPRDVQVGPPLGDSYPVISGLAEGDRVVTSAQFLIDSETNLAAAMQNMAMSMPGMDMGNMQMPAPGQAPSGAPSSAPSMPPMPGMSAMPPMPGMSSMPGMPMPPSTHTPSHPATHGAPPPPAPAPAPSPAPAPTPSSGPTPTPAPSPMPPMRDMPGMNMPMNMPMPSGMPMPPGHHHGS